MKITAAEIQKHLELLQRTPERIHTLVEGLDEDQLNWTPKGSTWSALENLAHLRACADLWTFSIYAMLAQEGLILPNIHPNHWGKIAGYASLPFWKLFQVFSLQRTELIRCLRQLSEREWSRSAKIGTREHTVFSQVRRMALHEISHCVQLEALIQSLHREDPT